MVKPYGRLRLYFRYLNSVTPQVQAYIPTLDDLLERVYHSSVSSKLSSTNWQVFFYRQSADRINSIHLKRYANWASCSLNVIFDCRYTRFYSEHELNNLGIHFNTYCTCTAHYIRKCDSTLYLGLTTPYP